MKAPRTVTSCIVRSAELRSGRSKTIIRRRRTGVHIHLLLWFLKRDCSLSITMAILSNRLWTSLKRISALQLKQYSWAFVRATTKFWLIFAIQIGLLMRIQYIPTWTRSHDIFFRLPLGAIIFPYLLKSSKYIVEFMLKFYSQTFSIARCVTR